MEPRMKACGVILAGGQSSRMGQNKALLEIGGQPLIRRLAGRMTAWFEQVVIVTNTPETYAFLGLPLVGDRVPGLGPLGGLEAGLNASHYEHAFFCAVDMPFVHQGLVRHMVALAAGHDIVVPVVRGEFEPMHAVYGRGCLPAISQNLEARRLRLISIFDRVRRRELSEEEVRRFGDPDRLFFNCNTPEDLEQARRWAEEEG
ncbi:MAG: molybdenum cofactor guanylyltransferase [Bacillota bacterium]